MTNGAFDDRLVTLTVEVDGETITYDQTFDMRANGIKYTNGNLGECAVRIDNISRIERDLLVTKTSPWQLQRTWATVSLYAGRASTKKFLLFAGQAKACNPTQPPDIGLVLQSLTIGVMLGNIGTLNAGPLATAQNISQQIATQTGLALDYQAKNNPQVGNYAFTGAVSKQVAKLNEFAGIYAYVDNKKLVVVDNPPPEAGMVLITAQTGMVGVPEVTEVGINVKMLILGELKAGTWVTVQSSMNTAVNGNFWIYQLGYEIATRDTPFYWLLQCRKFQLGAGQP